MASPERQPPWLLEGAAFEELVAQWKDRGDPRGELAEAERVLRAIDDWGEVLADDGDLSERTDLTPELRRWVEARRALETPIESAAPESARYGFFGSILLTRAAGVVRNEFELHFGCARHARLFVTAQTIEATCEQLKAPLAEWLDSVALHVWAPTPSQEQLDVLAELLSDTRVMLVSWPDTTEKAASFLRFFTRLTFPLEWRHSRDYFASVLATNTTVRDVSFGWPELSQVETLIERLRAVRKRWHLEETGVRVQSFYLHDYVKLEDAGFAFALHLERCEGALLVFDSSASGTELLLLSRTRVDLRAGELIPTAASGTWRLRRAKREDRLVTDGERLRVGDTVEYELWTHSVPERLAALRASSPELFDYTF